MGKPLLFVAVPLGLAGLVAGCGSSDKKDTTATSAPKPAKTAPAAAASSSAAKGGSTLTLGADPSGALKFTASKLATKAGKVTIVMTNPSSVPHAIAVEGNGVDKDGQTVTSGGKSTVTADLKPGTYEFYCPVDSHKQQGMEGTLTVT
jgi:plastocyanin